MNIDAKVLHKILANRIQQYTKRITYHDQVRFIQSQKDGSTYANQLMQYSTFAREYKTHMIISIDVEKASDRFQHPFMIKILYKSGYNRNISQHNKSHSQQIHCQHNTQK